MRKKIPPIKQELAVPAASAFCPNVTQGTNHAIIPELKIIMLGDYNLNLNLNHDRMM